MYNYVKLLNKASLLGLFITRFEKSDGRSDSRKALYSVMCFEIIFGEQQGIGIPQRVTAMAEQ